MEVNSFVVYAPQGSPDDSLIIGVANVPSSQQAEDIVITQQTRGVHVLNVYEQKCIQSWLFPPKLKLTSPTVIDSTSKSFACIQEYETLCSWTKEVTDVNKIEKIKLPRKALQILQHKLLNGWLMIVYENGQFGFINSFDKQYQRKVVSPQAEFDPRRYSILSTQLIVPSNESGHASTFLYLSQITQNNQDNGHTVTYFHINPKELVIEVQGSLKLDNSAKRTIISSSFESTNRELSLLWSDGTWDVYNYPSTITTVNNKSQMAIHFSTKPTLKLSHKLAAFHVPSHLDENNNNNKSKSLKRKDSAAADQNLPSHILRSFQISSQIPNNFAIVGQSSDQNSFLLTLWETMYGTLQGSHSLLHRKDGAIQSSSTNTGLNLENIDFNMGEIVQLLPSPDTSFLTIVLTNAVIVATIYVPPPSLASVVGKMNQTLQLLHQPSGDKTSSALPPVINLDKTIGIMSASKDASDEPVPFDEELSEQWNRMLTTGEEHQSQLLQMLADSSALSEESFNKKWKETVGDSQESFPFLSSTFSNEFVRRCLRRQEIKEAGWIWTPITDLISHGYVSARANNELIPLAIKLNRIQILHLCIRHVVDISAAEVVVLIQFFLNNPENPRLKRLGKPTLQESYEYIMDQLLRVNAPHLLLQQALAKLNLNQTISLLTYLIQSFKKHINDTPSSKSPDSPSLARIIAWINWLIDAHFIELILAKDSHPQIEFIKKLLDDQILLADKLKSLAGTLKHIIDAKPLPAKPLPDYTIQVIRF